MKRPLVWAACAYAAGIAAAQAAAGLCGGHAGTVSEAGMILGILALAGSVYLSMKKRRLWIYSIWPAFLVFGLSAGIRQWSRFLEVVPDSTLGDVRLTGRAERITSGQEGRVTVLLKECLIEGYGEKNNDLQVLLYAEESDKIGSGDLVDVYGEVRTFERASNPGQFDAAWYYAGDLQGGIFYFCWPESVRVAEEGRNSPGLLHEWREKVEESYRRYLPEKEAGILLAMLLGEKELLDEEIEAKYEIGGISHILAISGFHISLIGMAVYRLLKKVLLPELPAVLISTAAVGCYCFLTGNSVSALRAAVMFGILLMSYVAGRTYDTLSALSASALFVLWQNPFQLYQAGFLLSFGAIVGLGAVLPACSALAGQKGRMEKREADSPLWRAARMVLPGLLSSLSVQVVLTPILMWFFFEIPLWSVPVNLAVLPLSSLVTLSGGLGGLAGLFSGALARFVFGAAYVLLKLFEWMCDIAAGLPCAVIITGRPLPAAVAGYYLILTVMLAVIPRWKGWSLLLMLPLAAIFIPKPAPALVIEFLDVGQGDGIVILTDGFSGLVDCGSSSVSDVGTYRLIPRLKEAGIRELDLVAATHADADHCNGITALIRQSRDVSGIRIGAIAISECARDAEGYAELLECAARYGIPVRRLKAGDCIVTRTLSLECLHPAEDYGGAGNDNDASLVFYLRSGMFSALLTGDLEAEGERQITKLLEEKGGVTLLKAAHHGAGSSTGEEFLKAVLPRITVISYGRDNRYGHPHADTIDRLRQCKSRIYNTAEDGAVRVEVDGDQILIKRFNDRKG